ncbi:hypothetical protein [Halorussus marinus]|uniref:hypothetical protein n=1 Tax=Halorussus marinus TaxID=2505976 RepID=UPI00106E6864|nr:hypothetical protein [Halorussus marinus]
MATVDAHRDVPADEPDSFFGFVVGLYVAALLAPVATVGVAVTATTEAGVLFFTFLGVGTAGVAVGWRAAGREAVAVRLGSTRWAWLAPVAGLAYGGGVLAATGVEGPASGIAVGLALLGAVGGLVGGTGLVLAAHNRHAKAVLAGSERRVRFSTTGPERDRRLAKWAVGALMLGGTVGFAASIVAGFESLRWLFHLMIAGGAGLSGAVAERTYVVADAGVRVGTPVHKRVRPWSRFESYSLTDDELRVRRAGWSPWGLRDLRLDPEEIDDVAAVRAVLDAHLPRR